MANCCAFERKTPRSSEGKQKKVGPKQRVILTFKPTCDAAGYPRGWGAIRMALTKFRDEIEVEVTESGNLARIFRGAGDERLVSL